MLSKSKSSDVKILGVLIYLKRIKYKKIKSFKFGGRKALENSSNFLGINNNTLTTL